MATVPQQRGTAGSQLSSAPFDELLTEVLARVSDARDEQVRWRLLLDAVVTLGAGLSLDDLLSRIVQVAGDLAGARYAALGVLGGGGARRLRLFVTRGLDDEQISSIGDFPEGHGVLGVLIDRPEPVRLHDIAEHPQSFGFPASHPPMHSFLGVPVRTGDKVFGNLYLTEKSNGGDFTEQDEEIVVALAAAAGVAIENAVLHEDAARRERWLDARADIAAALLGEVDRPTALQLVADRARDVADADLAWIVTGPDADMLRVEVVSGAEVDPEVLRKAPLRSSIASPAIHSGVATTVDDLSAAADRTSVSAVIDVSRIGPAVMVPLGGPDTAGEQDTVGLLAIGWGKENAARAQSFDVAVANVFAQQVAIAIRLAESRENRERLAIYDDRERIGRDLHDVVIQRLFAIGLRLQGGLKWTEQPRLRERLDEVVDEVDATIREIRRTIFELNAADRSGDVQTLITETVGRAASALKFRPSLVFEGPVRLRVGPAVAQDLLAVLGEALSNTSRHARASAVSVQVLIVDDAVVLRVSDDGIGVPADMVESGLANMRQRAASHGGTCTVAAAPVRGTVIEWSVPLA